MKFLADENFNGKIVNALRREYPEMIIIRVQDTVMYQSLDPDLLTWASDEGYILLTHDVKTMPAFANARLADGLLLSGVFIVRNSLPFRQVIDDLLAIAQASHADEWVNKVTFYPCRKRATRSLMRFSQNCPRPRPLFHHPARRFGLTIIYNSNTYPELL